jgi:Protein of unknown function (DUF1501)
MTHDEHYSRRHWLAFQSSGLLTAALASLSQPRAFAAPILSEARDAPPHLPAQAKRVIHICLCGGYSQIDTFDYKPALEQLHGKSLQSEEKPDVFFGKVGLLRKNDFAFQQRGESGLYISELFPHLATMADDLTFLRGMFAESSSHTPATLQENSGFRLNGFPTLGSWLSYGLGCETDELPAYVVLPDARGLPASGTGNWTNGFLPAQHQGVMFEASDTPIRDLHAATPQTPQTEQASRELQKALNELQRTSRAADDDLLARMKAYEMAAKMQLAVPRVIDFSQETAGTKTLYGFDKPETRDFARNCLLARRLLEAGVRFVQLYSGGAFGSPRINWDGHENTRENHLQEAVRIDQPVAALIQDLKSRGMLQNTLLLFTSEFGRTPFTQSGENQLGLGRDHNQYGFTIFMAGAGLKPGIAYGATDDIGWKAVENRTSWYDFHATVLHLLGIDHTRLTYYHNGIQRRLTNVHGEVIKGVLS